LSQAYLFFYDKLEKANYFLENILDTVDEELSGRLVQRLLEQPVSDGGQWDMVANLVAKYGLVPQSLYPDSWSAQASAGINQLITTKLREDALILRKLVKAGKATAEAKEKMMREIHLILTLTLGPPPSPKEEFTWTYKDKDEKVHELTTTPVKFAKELDSPKAKTITGSAVSEWFSLVNDPRNEYYSLLTVSRLGNIVGGRGITYVNVPISVLKDAAIKMLKAGLPVFFGSDVGKFSDRVSGVMDPGLIDYELGFNVKLGLSKAERLQTGESAMTHAMVLTAVHIVEEGGKEVIKRWRVENSWGEDSGEKGWFVMSDRWLDEFVYQVVVEPGFVDQSVRDVLGGKAKVLPLWDPMGSLA
jgi:bleomycin hydrolase